MRNIYFFTIFFVFTFLTSYAQRNAPVAGDAALLIDFLNKDYSRTNPDELGNVLFNDRAQICAILKKYVEPDRNDTLYNSSNINRAIEDIKLKIVDIEEIINFKKAKAKENLIALKPSGNLSKYNTDKDRKDLINEKENLLKTQWLLHERHLTAIQNALPNNAYAYFIVGMFIKKYDGIAKKNIDVYGMENTQGNIQKNLSFLTGDLALETVMDGLSKFLANRVKEELTIYLIEEVQRKMDAAAKDSLNILNELGLLLPATTTYLKNQKINENIDILNDIKSNIEKDISLFIPNLYNLKDSQRIKIHLESHQELYFALEGLQLYTQLSKVKHPVEYLELLKNNKFIQNKLAETPTGKQLSALLELNSMFIYSLTMIDGNEKKFVSNEFITRYGSQNNFLILYIGLLQQQLLLNFNIPQNIFQLNSLMSQVPPGDFDKYKEKVENFTSPLFSIIDNAERLYQNSKKIKEQKNNEDLEIKPQLIYEYVDDFIGLLENGMQSAASAIKIYQGNKDIDITQNALNQYFSIAKKTNQIVLDLQSKRYGTAMTTALQIPLLITHDSNLQQGQQTAFKLISFYNDLAKADDSEAVAHAIETFAMPVGSYRVKRGSTVAVSINSYPGLYVGAEFTSNDSLETAGFAGVTAPLGIAINWNKGYGIYVSVIDIAAPFRLRIDSNNETKTISDYTFKNILAPGLYFSIPLWDSPLALNIGAQYGPELDFSQSEDGELNTNFAEAFRAGVALTVDIPILNLYNKPIKTD
tara:strand:+ start:2079 stop:4349 length:2271 start_codon:yes stop_codon:yes gene_type:complete